MSHFYFDTENNGHRSFELPGAKPHYNPDRPGQVEHIFLDLNLDIPNQSYSGSCNIRLLPVRNGIDSLTLDAVNLNIKSVQVDEVEQKFDYDGEQVDEVEQKFDYDGEQLVIKLSSPAVVGKQLLIAIAYSVEKPQRGIYFIQPDKHYPNKPTQVWTQGEDEDSRFWFPCFDYPGQLSTSEIRVRVPKPFPDNSLLPKFVSAFLNPWWRFPTANSLIPRKMVNTKSTIGHSSKFILPT